VNCTNIDQHIDGFLDRGLSSLRAQAFEQHVSRCGKCAQKVDAEKQLRSLLHSIPVPPTSSDFKKRVFTRVRQEYARERQSHYMMQFAAGITSVAVFGLSLWLLSGLQTTNPIDEQAQVITMAMNESKPVRLMFDADTQIQQAELSVELPDNVRLAGYPGRNRLSWQTSLQKGQNVLELPVEATNEGRGELRTQLSYNNKIKTFQFIVVAQGEGPSRNAQNF